MASSSNEAKDVSAGIPLTKMHASDLPMRLQSDHGDEYSKATASQSIASFA